VDVALDELFDVRLVVTGVLVVLAVVLFVTTVLSTLGLVRLVAGVVIVVLWLLGVDLLAGGSGSGWTAVSVSCWAESCWACCSFSLSVFFWSVSCLASVMKIPVRAIDPAAMTLVTTVRRRTARSRSLGVTRCMPPAFVA
jgi:hypothetical protein